MLDPTSFSGLLAEYGRAIGWSVAAAIGFSFGVGFKFKPIGNQVDLSYYFGNREYSDISEKELIQQIQIGVSIADLWFVKMRQK